MRQDIGDIRQYTSTYLRKSNKLNTSVIRQLANNLVASPIFVEVLGEKLSNSSNRDLYMHCRMSLAIDTVNTPAPQFVEMGLLTINSLDISTSIWTPATIV